LLLPSTTHFYFYSMPVSFNSYSVAGFPLLRAELAHDELVGAGLAGADAHAGHDDHSRHGGAHEGEVVSVV
jgi:hypothetical protein